MGWGYNNYGQLGNGSIGGQSNIPVFVVGNYNFSKLYAGSVHLCGLLQNGTALCWGYGTYGVLGENNNQNRGYPVSVYGNYSFSSMSLGTIYSCGILENKTLMCWGRNNYGQVGDGTIIEKWIPTPVKID